MCNFNQKLTCSQIKYLFTIKELSKQSQEVHSIDVAVITGLSKSSVHKMMNTLSKMGLVLKKPYGSISLTEDGDALIKQYDQCYGIIYNVLTDFVCEDKQTNKAVISFLSDLSSDSITKILSYSK